MDLWVAKEKLGKEGKREGAGSKLERRQANRGAGVGSFTLGSGGVGG